MGTNVAILSLAPALSGLVFGQINGALYRMQSDDGGRSCSHSHCFRNTFILSGCISLLAIILGIWLGIRTPAFDRRATLEKQPLITNGNVNAQGVENEADE